ncbi:MAG: CopD family protein [Phycisphaerales bacterium]
MLYQLLVIVHLLGASVWVGGHLVLVLGVLPRALRAGDAGPVAAFERAYGRVGLSAMVAQLVTGIWLADRWLGGWKHVFSEPTPSTHRVFIKLGLVVATLLVGGYAYHKVVPKLASGPEGLRRFAVHAWITTALAIGLVVAGGSIRMGGPL